MYLSHAKLYIKVAALDAYKLKTVTERRQERVRQKEGRTKEVSGAARVKERESPSAIANNLFLFFEYRSTVSN